MKKVIMMLMIFIMAVTMVACGNNTPTENEVMNENVSATTNNDEVMEDEVVVDETPLYETVFFTDGAERMVTITEEPMRIVSMAPSTTEMVYALGLGDRLVGRTDYCNFPEATQEVESIGSLREPNIEGIIALNPDIVFISSLGSDEVIGQLEEAGITVAVLTAHESFDGVYDIINNMAMIFHVEEAATTLTEQMKTDVEAVMTLVSDVEKKSVYYVVGYGEYGDYTATGDTFIHSMLEMAGGTNIAADGVYWSYNLESLLEKDPEIIIVSELFETKKAFSEMDGYKDLTAVKNDKVFEIKQDLLSRQGPRLAEGLKAIAQILHPELFE